MADANFIVSGARDSLEKGLVILGKRNDSYNRNGIQFEDYKLNGLESTWCDILECFVRTWNTGAKDPRVDWTVYSALQAELVAAGIPQSKFAPIFQRYLPDMFQAMKERDEQTGTAIKANYPP